MIELQELAQAHCPPLPDLEPDQEWALDYVRSEQGRTGDARDSDPFYVPEVDTFEGCRPVFTWTCCACYEDCSTRAWGKVWKSNPSFMDSLDTMRAHLRCSGKHNLSDEKIVDKLKDLCEGGEDGHGRLGDYMKVEVETAEDRDKYREYKDNSMEKEKKKALEKKSGAARKRPRPDASGGGGLEPKATSVAVAGSAARPSSIQLREENFSEPPLRLPVAVDAPAEDTIVLRNFQLTTATAGEVRAAISNRDVMRMSFRQAQVLYDSLRRQKEGIEQTIAFLQAMIGTLNAEARVVSAATRILQEVIAENSQ